MNKDSAGNEDGDKVSLGDQSLPNQFPLPLTTGTGLSGGTESDAGAYVTASVLLEYLFCPRFIYFMNCLCIDQNEDKRYKVRKGREVHEGKLRVNTDYLRRRIGSVGKKRTSTWLRDRIRFTALLTRC